LNHCICGDHDYKKHIGFGFLKFIRRDVLIQKSSDLLPFNKLKLRFVIDLIEPNLVNSIDVRLAHDLEKMINNKEFSDFRFIVGNKVFYGHKIFLSKRSKIYEAMFANDMEESRDNQCVIHDIECDVFEELLKFIYTGIRPKVDSMAKKLLVAAEKYEILDLKSICEDIIFRDITIENAIQTLIFADRHMATKLIDKIIDFIVINLSLFPKSSREELQKFITENPKLVLKIFDTIGQKSLLINCKLNYKERNWIYGNF
jgi:hypothetical protein